MNRRLFTALAASAIIVATVMPVTASAAEPTRQFERLDVSKIDPKLGPAMLANKPVTVAVAISKFFMRGFSKKQGGLTVQ